MTKDKTLEERFDEKFSSFCCATRVCYTDHDCQKTDFTDFIKAEILRHLEMVVPEEEEEVGTEEESYAIDAWNSCRQEVLNKIDEIKEEL